LSRKCAALYGGSRDADGASPFRACIHAEGCKLGMYHDPQFVYVNM
jgi:hypothetical protein